MTLNTGFPSLKTACMTTPSEYMSEAESQLTDRMYSGATYSGLGRQRGGRLGSHSLHTYLGYDTKANTFTHIKTYIFDFIQTLIVMDFEFIWQPHTHLHNQSGYAVLYAVFLTSASDGLLEEMLKSKPMIFQEPLLFRMMFSRHRLPCTIFTPLCRNDNPSEIWVEETQDSFCQQYSAYFQVFRSSSLKEISTGRGPQHASKASQVRRHKYW